VGDEIPTVTQKLTIPVMQRWVASSETLRRDHYDAKFAIEHDNIPNAVMSGSFSQAYIWQLLFNWVGPDGWVLKAFQKNAKMVHPGNTLTFFGSVTDKYEKNGLGYVELELGLRIEVGRCHTHSFPEHVASDFSRAAPRSSATRTGGQ
jgi:acyl dehydratase